MSSFRTGRLLPQPPKSKLLYKIPLTNLRPHYLKLLNQYLGLIVCECICVCTCVRFCLCVRVCAINVEAFFTQQWIEWVCCICVCVRVCVHIRAHARDGQRFLEDGLAGKLSLYRHGYQPGGGGQGEFIIQGIAKYVCLEALNLYGNTKFMNLRYQVV